METWEKAKVFFFFFFLVFAVNNKQLTSDLAKKYKADFFWFSMKEPRYDFSENGFHRKVSKLIIIMKNTVMKSRPSFKKKIILLLFFSSAVWKPVKKKFSQVFVVLYLYSYQSAPLPHDLNRTKHSCSSWV